MRRFLPLLLLVLPACTPAQPQPSGRVRQMVETEVRTWHRDHHADCPEFIKQGVEYQGNPREGHTEVWTVAACGKTFRYQARVDADFGSYAITVASLE
jgi:hypothetical protein